MMFLTRLLFKVILVLEQELFGQKHQQLFTTVLTTTAKVKPMQPDELVFLNSISLTRHCGRRWLVCCISDSLFTKQHCRVSSKKLYFKYLLTFLFICLTD